MAVVGIDLGTTNTVTAAVQDGRAASLKDKSGRALLPSVVSFGPKGSPKVGYPAKDRRTLDPENTVFSIKRLIGRTFDSEPVQRSIPLYPFTLREGSGKSTVVSCHDQEHSLPEVSSLVLQEAVTIAEQRLGERVSDAVITVPANFNDLQRAATKIAARTAGLEVLRIINEPTAAALAYGFGKGGHERIVVYDFGGGTFDVTLLDLNENVFEVLATAGDSFLGGDDIDRSIMERMAESLLKEQKVDASRDFFVREQLRTAAETLKIELSTRSMAKVHIEDLDFNFVMRRSEFESLVEPLLARTLSVSQEALDIAGVFTRNIDQVLLVGGSTRIPLVRRRVSSFFAKMPQSRINPDEVVAIGAAIQAAALETKQSPTHLPAPPRPRAQPTAGRASFTDQADVEQPIGITKTGLAGLRKTLSGSATTTDPSPVPRSPSVLSGLKALSPSGAPYAHRPTGSGTPPQPTGLVRPSALPNLKSSLPEPRPSLSENVATPPRKKLDTLSGVGEPTNKVHTAEEQPQRAGGTTNLGLGQAPNLSPIELGPPPPDAGGIVPIATPTPMFPVQQEDKMFDSVGSDSGGAAADGDGSVTFDLAELEAEQSSLSHQAIAEDEFEDEETEIFARKDKLEVADSPSLLEVSSITKEYRTDPFGSELPVAVHREPRVEELGDSALFSLPDDDTDDSHADDLPALSNSKRNTSPRSTPSEVTDSETPFGHQGSAHRGQVELDLPTPVMQSGLPDLTQAFERESELPLPVVRAPSVDLPTYQTSHNVRTQLPSPHTQGILPHRKEQSSTLNRELTHTAIGVAPDANLIAQTLFGGEGARRPHQQTKPQPAETAAPQPGFDDGDDRGFSLDVPIEIANEESRAAPATFARSSPPLLLDVTPLSLGVEVVGGYVDRLIARNSPIPCASNRTFATASDNQSIVRVRVSQGEDLRFERNTVLGELQLTGLVPGPRGSVKIEVSFSLDESGMLQVSARDPRTGLHADAQLMLMGLSP